MTWRDRYQAASFKGVPFWIDGTSVTRGRRIAVRRLAGKDGSVNQDLGAEPDEIDIEAFLFGDDFDIERQDLEDALTEPGPGALVHPSRGELWVRVTRGPFTLERRTQLGRCSIRFSVVVEERGSKLKALRDTAGLLDKAAKFLKTVATADFSSAFDVAKMPGKYITAAASAVGNVAQNLRGIQGKINGTLNPIQDLSSAIDELSNSIDSLMRTPDVLATRMVDLVTSVMGLADTVKDSIDRTTGLSTLSDDPFSKSLTVRVTRASAALIAGLGQDEPETGPGVLGNQSAKNVRAVYAAARASVLARASQTYATAPFDSSSLALDVLNSAATEIDALLEYTITDDMFYALNDLRAALVEHLTQTAQNLPGTIKYAPKQELPLLVIAHDLYGDARMESDLAARNKPSNPLFVSGEIEAIAP